MKEKYYEVTIYDENDNLLERIKIIGMEEASKYLEENRPEEGWGKIRELKDESTGEDIN